MTISASLTMLMIGNRRTRVFFDSINPCIGTLMFEVYLALPLVLDATRWTRCRSPSVPGSAIQRTCCSSHWSVHRVAGGSVVYEPNLISERSYLNV
jgi:hypothetical protein